MKTSNDDGLRAVCKSALWQIEGNVPRTPSPLYKEFISEPDPTTLISADQPIQVMLSYEWDCQTRVKKLRDSLCAAGYKVWMDLTHMRKYL